MNEAKNVLKALGFFAAMNRPGVWVSDNGAVVVEIRGERIIHESKTYTADEFYQWCLN